MPIKVFLSIYFISFSKLSLQHFEQPSDFCFSASICNHTSIPVCGKEKRELNTRLFQDQCDLMEYNCDYKKEYLETSFVECQQQQTKYTTSIPETSMTSSISEKKPSEKSNNYVSTTHIESTSTRNLLSTTESVRSSSNTNNNQESKGKCTCHLLTTKDVNVTKATTKTVPKTSSKQIITSTKRNEISITSNSITTDITKQYYSESPSTKPCTRKKFTTAENVNSTPSTKTKVTVKPTEDIINVTNATQKNIETSQATTKETTKSTNNNLSKSTNGEEIKSTSTTNIKPQVSSQRPCLSKTYPKNCNRPTSWETTVKGETRDFYQILRSRYGDRLKLLRGTTNWPRRVNLFKRVKHEFIHDRHNES